MDKKRMKTVSILCIMMAIALLFMFCKNAHTPKQQPSSIELINRDLVAEEIDYETALLYKAYATFYHPDLPKKYRSDIITKSASMIFKEIRINMDSFSEETQKKLEPFFLNPLDPNSIQHMDTGKHKPIKFIAEAYANPPDIAGLQHYVTEDGKVKIWYKPYQKAVARSVRDAFYDGNIYEEESILMGTSPMPDNGEIGDDNKFDIFFKAMSSEGLCWFGPITNRKCYAWIHINEGLIGDKLKDATAHEFFHAHQYAIDCLEDDWWQEATATWVQHYVFPLIDTEWEWLNTYFKKFGMCDSITTEDGKHEYATYVFPFYLAQKYGDQMIGNIWQACTGAPTDAEKAIDAHIPDKLKGALKDFSLWLFNEAPFKFFDDMGRSFPVTPDYEEIGLHTRVQLGEENHIVDPLAILHRRYSVDDPAMRSVDFDLEEFHVTYPKIDIWAIIKLKNGIVRKEDWSTVNFRNFCFDLPEEDIEWIQCIYSNGSPDKAKRASHDIKWKSYEYGCVAKVSLAWSLNYNASGAASFGKFVPGFMEGNARASESGSIDVVFREEIVDPDDPNGKQLMPYGHCSFQEQYTSGGVAGVRGVYSMGGRGTGSGSGSDKWDGKNDGKNKNGFVRLRIIKGEEEEETEISEDDLALLPPGMRQMYNQLQNMQGSLPPGLEIKEPKEGEIQYKFFLRIDGIPGQFSSAISIQGSGSASSGGSSEEIEVGMHFPIELEGIVPEGTTEIPVSKSFNSEGWSGRISGLIRLKKSWEP